jgi:hypothetical protein
MNPVVIHYVLRNVAVVVKARRDSKATSSTWLSGGLYQYCATGVMKQANNKALEKQKALNVT